MSFIIDNHYFYTHSLVIKMRGLTDLEKISVYKNFKNGNLTIQEEIRQRLTEYYNNFEADNIKTFYSEIIESLGFFETEYVLSNLFLEPNAIEIVNHVLSLNLSKFLITHDTNAYNRKIYLEFEKEFLTNKRVSKIFFYKIFYNKLNFLTKDFLSSTFEIDFEAIVNKYPNWLVNNLKNDIEFDSFYCFVILWQDFIIEAKSRKNILFLHKFISEYKVKFPVDLFRFVNSKKDKYNQFFNKKYFIPLITNSTDISSGFLLKKDEFDKLVFNSDLLNDKSYTTLFDKLIENNNNESLINQISIRIDDLITKDSLIDRNTIDILFEKNKNQHTNIFFNKIIRKFYFFKYYMNSNISLNPRPSINVVENQSLNLYDKDYKPVRIGNLAIDYNVSSSTIINFLYTRGYNIKNINNNSAITEQMFWLIHDQFLNQKKQNQVLTIYHLRI